MPVTTTMQIHLSPDDGLPIYLQIVNQVKYLVASGRLAPGEELPPIRSLAEQLLINPNTVVRAYRELEVAGIVTKRRTTGTYVSATGSKLSRQEQLNVLSQRIDALLAEARHMNVTLAELVDLLHERDEAMKPSPEDEEGFVRRSRVSTPRLVEGKVDGPAERVPQEVE